MITNLIAQAESQRVARIEWLNLPESWGVFVFLFVVVALFAAIVWMYITESASCPGPVKVLLALLRCTVVALLIIAYLKPSLTYVEQRTRKPNLVLLRDVSQSMSIVDKYEDDALAQRVAEALGENVSELREENLSRAEILDRALRADNGSVLNELRQKASIRVMHFSGDTSEIVTLPALNSSPTEEESDEAEKTDNDAASEGGDDTGLPTNVPIGTRTDIRQAIKAALNVGQLHGIVLCSDGQHTATDLPADVVQEAKKMGVPIYTVAVGDPRRVRNVSVSEVWVLTKARPGEPFEIDYLINGEDVRGQTFTVELAKRRVDPATGELGPEVSVATKQLVFEDESGNIRDQFSHYEDEIGKYRYLIKVSGIQGDEDEDDNVKQSDEVDVTKEKVRVLLIAGAPTWEYRMVQRLYQRDQNITLSCWLQSMDSDRVQEGNEPISVLPSTYEELAKYNVIMMFDPNPDEFNEDWIAALKRFCSEKAGGLMYMAGPKYTSDFLNLNRTGELQDILPVQFGNLEDSAVAQILASTNTSAGNLQVVIPNIDHQVLKFPGDRNENLELWEAMPGIYWSYPASRAKPTTQVLVEHGDITLSSDGENARPLIVAGRYGAGNTLYMGFNGTWRWRRMGRQAEFFDRFWIQVCNHLVNTRSIQGMRRGTVDPDRDEYELGDTIEFAARLLDPTYEPLKLPTVNGTLKIGDGQTLPITFNKVPDQDGEYRASFPAQRVGQFELQLDLPAATDEQKVDPVTVTVKPPQIETRARWLNEPLLREIADQSGGKYYHINELSQLADAIPEKPSSVEWKTLPEPIWSFEQWLRILCFVLPVVLLTLEWSLRKGFKLM